MRDLALDEPAALIYCPFRAPAPANLGRPPPHLRARCRLAPAGRAIRLERLCIRPQDRRAPRRRAPGRARPAHEPVRRRRQPDRHDARRRRHELPLVGHQERVARAPRRGWLRSGCAYGGFAREPFGDDSQEYVFVARRSSQRSDHERLPTPGRTDRERDRSSSSAPFVRLDRRSEVHVVDPSEFVSLLGWIQVGTPGRRITQMV